MATGQHGRKRNRAARISFYVDADLLGLAKLLVQVRSDVTFPGDPGGALYKRERPPCLIEDPEVKDPIWIPRVARQGWVILTRDSAIQGNRAEIDAVFANNARMVALASRDARTKFSQLELLMTRWRDIEGCVARPGPYIYIATRTTFRPYTETVTEQTDPDDPAGITG